MHVRHLKPIFFFALALFLATLLRAERPKPSGPSNYADREAAWERHQELRNNSLFRGLEWRSVGPVIQGGRVVDVESVPGEPYTFYVAYASGGLWRTNNNGVTFEPLFDDQPTIIMGDIAVDPSRPQTVWVGTGEHNSSRSSYGGMGVFRSDDGGDTWRHMGLGDSDRVGRILVDPRDSNLVYVVVLGRLYTQGGERGVYRTTDGGRTWTQVLAGEGFTGFIDLVMDPSNPDILYAAAWERSRRPWNFVEGGPGSGIYKSTDGGANWTRLSGGFPAGDHVGRIGLALAPSRPQTLYAVLDNQEVLPEELWDLGDGAVTAKRLRKMTKEEFLEQDPEEIEDFIRGSDLDTSLDAEKLIEMVENDEVTIQDLLDELDDANQSLFLTDIRGIEIWRSDDGGSSWRRTHEEPVHQVVYTYGYYFGQIRVAPDNPDRIYVVGVPLITSKDGGKTFEAIDGRDVHGDHHALWVDPNFPNRVITGNDGGIDITYDGGKSWVKLDAQPLGQFYAITVDMAKPYNIYGGLQDNGVLMGSSKTRPGISGSWRFIGGGDGMYVQVDNRDNKTVYQGFQFGYYFRNNPDGSIATVRPRDRLKEPAIRYNWTSPILLSRHNQDILYFGTNRLYRSMDKGDTWSAISPDMTRSQERGNVPFATLVTIAESPMQFGLLWVGTDDGHVHVSESGGTGWKEVSDGLPSERWVSRVEASHHERDVAYVSLNGYRDDDITSYLFRTEDLGVTWEDISDGLPDEPINVVREDPVNPDVLYVGTDRSVYVSLDQGANWQSLAARLPNVPVHGLVVHPRDRELVAGTHGRSVWVIDVLPVQDLSPEVREKAVHIYPMEDVQYARSWRGRRSEWFHRAEDDPTANITFWASQEGKVEISVLDDGGREIRKMEIVAVRGVNTHQWDLLLDEALALPAEEERLQTVAEREEESSTEGVRAHSPWAESVRLGRPLYITPGGYALRFRAAGNEAEIDFTVKKPEPRTPRMKKKEPIRGKKK